MEDEQGDVGQDSSGGVSASPLSDNLHSESLVENMGSDNQVDESYEEGGGGEIMVEVVGSDVYVDGVSGDIEGNLESGEVGDLKGHAVEKMGESQSQNSSEAMDVSSEEDGNKVGENDMELSESRNEKQFVATEEVDISSRKSVDVEGDAVSALPPRGDDVIVDEEWNPGIEAISGSSSTATGPNSEVAVPSPMVIIEEKSSKVEAVTKDDAIPKPLNHFTEAVLDEKTDIEEKKEVLPSNYNTARHDHFSSAANVPTGEVIGPSSLVISKEKRTEDYAVTNDRADIEEKKEVSSTDNSATCAPTEEITGPSPMEISEEKTIEDEAVPKHCADLVIPEPLNHPKEAVFDEKADIEGKKEVLPSMDDSATCAPTKEVTGPSPVVVSEEKSTEDVAVTKDSADLVTPEPLNHLAEEKELLPSSDNSANHVHFGADSVKSHEETEAAQDGVEPPEFSLNPNGEDLETVQVDGIDSVIGETQLVSDGRELLDSGTQEDGSFRVKAKLATTNAGSGIDEISVDDKEVVATELMDSILKSDAPVSDVQDENQGCINEFHDVKLVADDRVDGVPHAVLESTHDSSSVSERGEATGNDECLGVAKLETHKAHEKQVFSNETNQLTDVGDTDVTDEDKWLNVQILHDKAKNELHTKISGCPSDKKIVQADSDTYSDQPVIATTLGAAIDGQDAVISQVKIVDGGGSCERGEEINFEVLKECQGSTEIPAVDGSAENTHLLDEGACLKVETEDVMVMEDHVVGHNPIVNSEGFDNVVQESDSPQSTKQEVSVQTTETSNHEVENISLMPNEIAIVAAVSDTAQVCISPDRTEKAESVEENPGGDMGSNKVHKSRDEDCEPRECNGFFLSEGHTSEPKVMDVEEEQESDQMYHGGQEVDEELVTEGPSETEKLKSSSLRMSQSGYLTPPEKEGCFAQSDLVWGKVRSHPWWPGQIFDPADASEKAVKYHKKDSYLVAYFGDQTFAWNDSSALKPFRSHFSQIEKQSNSEAFQNAVTCALEEVERRVELGLACSCVPKDAYAQIETQVVENTGIREEASQRYGVDQSTGATHFKPDKLLEYVTGLAPRASSRADRLDLVIVQAQLSAFCRFEGYRSPTEFPSSGELLESDVDTEKISDGTVASHKRRHIPKDASQSKKERSLMELMGDGEYSPDADDELVDEDLGKSVPSSGKKRKVLDPPAEGSDKRVTVYAAKISTSATQTPKPSFKIGECIRRVASQLTGSTSSIKGSSDETVVDGSPNIFEHSEKQSVVVSAESLSVNEMLSLIELVAQDPRKRHNIQNNIRAFFLGFRSSIAINRRGRKKKSEQTVGGSGEEFEFDDVNDSYWTDRIVQNYPDEQLLHESENGAGNLQVVPFVGEKPVKPGRKPHSRKRFSSGVSPTAPTEVDENAKRRKQESSPAELILTFAERNRVPSEINLNKMFRRFGPLMESETEVDHESGCAKVIFKRGSDAEVARNSAEKFNIFGSALVSYQIGYSPVISVKILPVALPQPQEDATLMV